MSTVAASKTSSQPVARRYDFVLLFDVTDGNPNGDPDAGNLPRIDPQSLQGLVTDGCLKRKIRNAISVLGEGVPGNEMYFQTQDAAYERRILNLQHQRAYDELALKAEDKEPKKKADNTSKARAWMCANFYDIRAFGAVMTTVGAMIYFLALILPAVFSVGENPVRVSALVPVSFFGGYFSDQASQWIESQVVEKLFGKKGRAKK